MYIAPQFLTGLLLVALAPGQLYEDAIYKSHFPVAENMKSQYGNPAPMGSGLPVDTYTLPVSKARLFL